MSVGMATLVGMFIVEAANIVVFVISLLMLTRWLTQARRERDEALADADRLRRKYEPEPITWPVEHGDPEEGRHEG